MPTRLIPDIIVGRLPRYLRALNRMAQDGRQTTSSQELGERLGISAAQIRKDLSQFGEFGKQGTGYTIGFLTKQLQLILNVDRIWDMALVGLGDLGHAIVRYQGFQDCGFQIKLVFDNDPRVVGTEVNHFTVHDISEMPALVHQADIKIAMMTVPARVAQSVADQLVKSGIKAILNYAPVALTVPEGVHVQYIDPVIHLQRMTYYLE